MEKKYCVELGENNTAIDIHKKLMVGNVPYANRLFLEYKPIEKSRSS